MVITTIVSFAPFSYVVLKPCAIASVTWVLPQAPLSKHWNLFSCTCACCCACDVSWCFSLLWFSFSFFDSVFLFWVTHSFCHTCSMAEFLNTRPLPPSFCLFLLWNRFSPFLWAGAFELTSHSDYGLTGSVTTGFLSWCCYAHLWLSKWQPSNLASQKECCPLPLLSVVMFCLTCLFLYATLRNTRF